MATGSTARGRVTWLKRASLQIYSHQHATTLALSLSVHLAFAFGLLEGRHRLEACPPLADPAAATQRQALLDLLPPNGGVPQINLNA